MKEELMEEIQMNPKEENVKKEEVLDVENENVEKEEKKKEVENKEKSTSSSKKEKDNKKNRDTSKNDKEEKSKEEFDKSKDNKYKKEKNNKKKNKKSLEKSSEENKEEEKEQKSKKSKSKNNKKASNKKDKNKQTEKNDSKKEKKKIKSYKKLIISIIIIAIIALIFSTVFALTNINNEKIMSGISIEGIDVSGLTKDEAKAKLETTYNEKMQKNIDLKYQEFESELNPTVMEVKYDVETAVNEAYSLGRTENIFINNYNILGTLIGKRNIDVNMSMNEETAKQNIIDIGANLPGIMTESSYSIEGNNLIITRGKEGIVVNTDALLSQVKEILNDINITDTVIEIPVETKTPADIDIDKIHSEVYKEVQDAYYTKDPFTIYPEVEGVDFDVEKAKQMIMAEVKDEYIIELIITKPNVTIDQIGTEAFPDQLSTFTTRYDASDKDRSTNLVLACQKINGKIIKPGETFSYNETLGPRSKATGYKNAKVYENGQVVDGIGGGICQISSTLYNAVLMSDLDIVERRNHQFVTSYVGAGRDATVVYGATDFRFKNTRNYPIRIVASAKSGVATVSIFGIKEADREYTYSFSTQTISTIPYTTKYVEDASLAPGKEVVKQKGSNGLVTQTYMTKRLNGKVVSTELLSKDTYNAMQRIVHRGTSNATSSSNSSSTTPSTSTPNVDTPAQPSNPPTTDNSTPTQGNDTSQTTPPTETQEPEETVEQPTTE